MDGSENLDERLEEWKQRAQRGGDVGGTEQAADEHERYEEKLEDHPARRPDGALEPEPGQTRHETPPGSEQTAG